MVIALTALAIVDTIMIVAVFWLVRKFSRDDLPLSDDQSITTRDIQELRQATKEELEHAQHKIKELLNRIEVTAAEAEEEVRRGADTVAGEVEKIITQLSGRFDEPMKELQRKQLFIESLLQKLEREKKSVARLVHKGETICSFFDKRVPYEKILEEVKDKKYLEVRGLLAKGMKPQEVAEELGLSEGEVRVVAGVQSRGALST